MKNRWLIAASAVGIHVSIGSAYAWSVFNLPLESTYGWSRSEVAFTFSLAIFFLGLSAAVMGHFVEKNGPRAAGLLSTLLFGAGMLGSWVATEIGSLHMLWLSYGVLGGVGLGVGYIAPVSTLIKWFPDRRGLATGLAIMGFGFGAMIAAPIFSVLISMMGIPSTFLTMGVVYFVLMLGSSLYLERPPTGWMPDKMRAEIASGEREHKEDLSQMTASEAVKTWPFWGLWVMMFINITCGIAIIYAASPLAQESIGLTPEEAAAMVGLMALFNGVGRLAWASFSDYVGRPQTYVAFFILQIACFYFLPSLSSALMFQAALFLILTCYGGGFATLPAFIGDLFGTRQLAVIHGYTLTAWALAGLTGPQLAAYVRSITGSYASTLYLFAGLFCVALSVSLMIHAYVNRKSSSTEGMVQLSME